MTKKTKFQKVLEHFQSGKSLTRLQCLNAYGTLNLPDIVWKLKRQGYEFEVEMIEGNDSTYGRWKMIQSETAGAR